MTQKKGIQISEDACEFLGVAVEEKPTLTADTFTYANEEGKWSSELVPIIDPDTGLELEFFKLGVVTVTIGKTKYIYKTTMALNSFTVQYYCGRAVLQHRGFTKPKVARGTSRVNLTAEQAAKMLAEREVLKKLRKELK